MCSLLGSQILSDKERLLKYGYKPQHIVELPDGSAILDLEAIRQDFSLNA